MAKRRLAHIGELDRTGRWKWYYTEEQFSLYRRDAERAVSVWAKLAGLRPAVGKDGVRPAA